MGIDIGWKMVQGATLDVWEEAFGEDETFLEDYDGDMTGFLEDHLNVVRVSPWYDADSSDCIYGVKLAGGDYSKDVDLAELAIKAAEIAHDLKNKYGIDTTTICSQNVW